MDIIIYKKADNSAMALYPTDEGIAALGSIETLADRDVPTGLPYWLIDSSSLPVLPRDKWVFDGTEGTPDGTGA